MRIMDLYRKHRTALTEWKNRDSRKPLVLRGARQVGKTWLVRRFAREEYQYFLEINFDETPAKRDLFAPDDIDMVLRYLSLDADVPIIPGETLIFLDEIQQAPEVLGRLRYFYEKSPSIHVIAAGSLLDFVLAEHTFSMPVGRIEYLHLGPLDFLEFLHGIGAHALHDFVRNWELNETIPDSIHQKLLGLTRLYMSIGGMPAVVREYAATQSLRQCDRELAGLVQTFRDDFSKYGTRVDVELLRLLFDKAPGFIGRKVKYSEIDRSRKAEEIKGALMQLERARILYRVFHSSGNAIPLGAERKERSFKLLSLDSGLFLRSLGSGALDLLNQDLVTARRGAAAEQFVGRQWFDTRESYEEPELYYWNREKAGTTAEVDFLFQIGGIVVPVEVKAGTTGSLKSLHVFASEKRSLLAIRFNTDLPAVDSVTSRVPRMREHTFTLLSLPLYLVSETARLASSMG
ncbi:MAG: DUF4143 domain-containing protein [Spirochaetaceae bacterium]|nr:MAG: DUF4143 domain-containing protein [Spirochaetaceae bacterium]